MKKKRKEKQAPWRLATEWTQSGARALGLVGGHPAPWTEGEHYPKEGVSGRKHRDPAAMFSAEPALKALGIEHPEGRMGVGVQALWTECTVRGSSTKWAL